MGGVAARWLAGWWPPWRGRTCEPAACDAELTTRGTTRLCVRRDEAGPAELTAGRTTRTFGDQRKPVPAIPSRPLAGRHATGHAPKWVAQAAESTAERTTRQTPATGGTSSWPPTGRHAQMSTSQRELAACDKSTAQRTTQRRAASRAAPAARVGRRADDTRRRPPGKTEALTSHRPLAGRHAGAPLADCKGRPIDHRADDTPNAHRKQRPRVGRWRDDTPVGDGWIRLAGEQRRRDARPPWRRHPAGPVAGSSAATWTSRVCCRARELARPPRLPPGSGPPNRPPGRRTRDWELRSGGPAARPPGRAPRRVRCELPSCRRADPADPSRVRAA